MSKSTKKSKKRTIGKENDEEFTWTAFDELAQKRGITISPQARRDWNTHSAHQRQCLIQAMNNKKRNVRDAMVPLQVDESRDPAVMFEIGANLLADEPFDTTQLQLTTKFNLTLIGTDRAPGMSDEAVLRLETLTTSLFLPSRLEDITFDTLVHRLVNESHLTSSASSSTQSSTTTAVEASCFPPLLWLAERLHGLPLQSKMKTLYIEQARMLASTTTRSERVWKHVVMVINAITQDLADYLCFAKRVDSPDDDEEVNEKSTRSKRSRRN